MRRKLLLRAPLHDLVVPLVPKEGGREGEREGKERQGGREGRREERW